MFLDFGFEDRLLAFFLVIACILVLSLRRYIKVKFSFGEVRVYQHFAVGNFVLPFLKTLSLVKFVSEFGF